MELREAIGTRRSYRYLDPDRPVEVKKIQRMLEAARIASHFGNNNAARALVVDRHSATQEQLESLPSPVGGFQIQQAPIVILWYVEGNAMDYAAERLIEPVDVGALGYGRNAVRKAKDVAGRFSSGIVIAADTVVVVGRQVIGKPKSRKDALSILQLLSRQPHWVHTGLAVVDIDVGAVYTAHDKTRVYMYRLTDDQIKQYLRRAPVLDKAGGFDIQGLGGVFIDSIEGCFYNVVGLPLAKLVKILHRLGVDIFEHHDKKRAKRV